MPHDLQSIIQHVRTQSSTTTHQAILVAEIERLRRDCGELYQVIGYLADRAGLFLDPQTAKALDNAWAAAEGAARPHDDLLPFPTTPTQETTDV